MMTAQVSDVNTSLLRVTDLNYSVAGRELLRRISFSLQSGELLVVLGRNGAGKSTLLKHISGDLHGRGVELFDLNLGQHSPKKLAQQRATLPQSTPIAFAYEVLDVVLLGRIPHGSRETDEDRAISAACLARVGLQGYETRNIQTLSGGEQQRVHLARTLAQLHGPATQKVLLLDEPTASLDLAHQHSTLRLARDLRAHSRRLRPRSPRDPASLPELPADRECQLMATNQESPRRESMTTLARTPIDHDDAQEIIEHVNEGHIPELLLCARAFTPISSPTHTQMTDVFTDGFQLDVTNANGTTSHFVAYSVQESPHVAIRATVDAAMKQLGLKSEARVAHWNVLENRVLTPHFRRLVLDLQGDTREDWHPGYACRFDVPGQQHGRPYTLRRLNGTRAEVDVYCHDHTLGSQWAEGLQVGQTVTARGGRQEGFPDFSRGAALLLGDETALPTIAALLEGWAEEHPVRVVLEVSDAAEQRYLDDVYLPRDVHVSWLPRTAESGASLRAVLDTLETPPTAVWGALEVESAKSLRKQLQADYPDADVRITGYWRVNEKN